jgi:hypothetical protein
MQKKHYFNWTYLTLLEDEKEEFYRHPSLPFSVNQLGAIFPDEGYSISHNRTQGKINLLSSTTNAVIKTFTKSRGVLECFIGFGLGRGRMPFVHFDGNSDNYTKSNLLLRKDLTIQQVLEANENANNFIKASEDYLDELCKRLTDKGLDVKRYLDFMALPLWLTYRGYKSVPVVKVRTISKKKPNTRNIERMEACHQLREQGLSQVKIAQALGLSSRTAVRYWLRKYDLIKQEDIYNH